MKLSNSSVTAATAREEAWEFNRSQGTWFSASRQTFVTNAMRPFGMRGPRATHQCTGYENTNKPHWMLGRRLRADGPIHPHILKGLIPSVLRCLDFLHTACHAIHTGTHLPASPFFTFSKRSFNKLTWLLCRSPRKRLSTPCRRRGCSSTPFTQNPSRTTGAPGRLGPGLHPQSAKRRKTQKS